MKKLTFIFSGIVVIASVLTFYWLKVEPFTDYLLINGQKIHVEVVADPAVRKRGLSGRDNLPEDSGMLFLFPRVDNVFFWMKGMKFPIDIIWIKGESVIGIEHNVPVPTQTKYPHYIPSQPVDKVLEINAGEAKKIGIAPGQPISFHLLGGKKVF